MARYAYNPFTGNLDRIGDGGGGGSITDVTALNAGSSVDFEMLGTVANLELTDSSSNTLIGENAGNATLSGSSNSSLGVNSLNALTTGDFNTSIGRGSLQALTSGQLNVALGFASGNLLQTGISNTLIGNSTGINYTGAESNNVLLGFDTRGTVGESGVIRIGNCGNGGSVRQAACYIDGIVNTSITNQKIVTINDTTSQLSVMPLGNHITTAEGTITSAQIKTLRATPIQVAPAPGVGKLLRIISVTMKLNLVGSAFTGSGTIVLIYDTSATAQCVAMTNAPMITAGNTTFIGLPNLTQSYLDGFTTENRGLYFGNSSVTEFGGNGAGGSSIKYSVIYETVNV